MYNFGDNLTLKEKIEIWWEELWKYTSPFCNIRDIWYATKCYLFKRYDLIRTKLPKTRWIDKDQLMLYGMMELLVDYVEGEKCFEVIDWESEETHLNVKKEIKAIYDWWKNYKNRIIAIENQLNVWHDEFITRPGSGLDKFNKAEPSDKEKIESDKLYKMESDLDNEEQLMLIRLVKIRRFLWT